MFVLWFHCWDSLDFHWLVRWFWISLLMVLLRSGRVGSLGLAVRTWFLSSILERILSGSGIWCELILPLGMWCLSAVKMALVRVWLAVCTLDGRGFGERMSSIS